MKVVTILVLTCVLSYGLVFAGTTGKIAGTVTDATTGEKLISANVLIEGTTMGASADLNGYYAILNVPPGTYKVRISLLGYATTTIENVRVNIDQTTNLDVSMTQANITTKEVVVVAQRPVVQKDVSASTTNLSSSDIQNLPAINTISNVMGLQAGVQINSTTGDLVIRGGGGDQTAFMLDGNIMRDERNNTPYLGISLSSVKDIQIQTGGFNAEYGNIRSGIVNVITKDGSTSKYTFTMIGRYSPPQQKHFGPSPNDPNSYWIRPFVDPTVAWTGTGDDKNPGPWDQFTRHQYPYFQGWNAVSAATLVDNNPNNDLTPAAAQQLFLWQHRRFLDINKPDYDIDASFGGPVPYGETLGNLRFFASYRGTTSQYLVPLSKDAYTDYNAQLKITSDIGSGMKLVIEGLNGQSAGTNNNNSGLAGVFTSPQSIASNLYEVSYIDARIFATDYWAPTTIIRNMLGAKFTQVLTPETFYEVASNVFTTHYNTDPGRNRNITPLYVFGNADSVDEAPFGYQPQPSTGINGLRMGVGFSNSRDTSYVAVWTNRFDITSQIDRYDQFKAGAEFVYIDNNVNYGSVDVFLPSGRSRSYWHTYPKRAAAYVQDKIEFQGMIANLGVRLDYSHAGGYWYNYSTYDPAFTGDLSLGMDTLLAHVPTKQIWNLSPRLGVSFPITDNSKLYFNYGHFRSMPTPENLYLIRRYSDNNQVVRVADPNAPLPKTVAYELGYEQNLFDQFLLHLAGYYKDVSDEATTTEYISKDGKIDYSKSVPNLYEDIRGFELSLSKNRGDWVQGFVNYTYQVSSSGRFGWSTYYQDPLQENSYINDPLNIQNDLYQSKPVPTPYARANVDFFMPNDFGPQMGELYPLGSWRLSLLGNWQAGSYFTWAGGGAAPAGLQNNVQWKDYYNLDLRLSKTFTLSGVNFEFFMDMTNALNLKHFTVYGFYDANDFNGYMQSLHLPAGIADKLNYGNIPGSDQPGDYRDFGVDFVPMVYEADAAALQNVASPVASALYYVRATGQYMQWSNNQWVPADQNRVDQVLKDKAYIDMPNLNYFTFLNPRQIFWGLRVSVDI